MKPALLSPWLPAESEIRSALDRFERMFADSSPFRRPALDVFETEGSLTIQMDIPGVDIDKDVEIKVEEDMLDISGETHRESERTEDGTHITERSFGKFRRRIVLPDNVDADAIEASYELGVLTVTVPLPEPTHAEPKVISVKHD